LEKEKNASYLEVENASVYYDMARVLNNVSIHVEEGEIVSIVGPNGAGKSTLLRTIAGLVKWEKDSYKGTKHGRITIEGTVRFNDEEVSDLPSHKRAEKGLILCPERGRPFVEMTIFENLMVAAHLYSDKGIIQENLNKVYELFPVLAERRNQTAGTLSGGERTMLAIGRALMSQAKLLLVDEPSTGLSPLLTAELFKKLLEIHGFGLTILLVEQDVSYAFEISNRNYVISKGHIIAQGTEQELLEDELLRKTYLGL
jgi:branched-chain amino acid transport system ATP-binding protein